MPTKNKIISIDYIDPITGGLWKITSHRKLKSEEIEEQIKFILSAQVERPKKGRISMFRWPESL